MSNHTIVKIIEKNAKKKNLYPGDYIDVEVDFTLVNDFFSSTINTFTKFKPNKKVFNPMKSSFCFNYFMTRANDRVLKKEKMVDEIIAINNFSTRFDIHKGTWREEFINNKLANCGEIVITADSHTPTLGGLGIFALGVGEYDLASSLITGRIWIKIPEVIEIRLDGEIIKNVTPIDVALYVIKNLNKDSVIYKVIEFTGSYIDSLDPASRMTFCDLFSELEIKTCYIKPSKAVLEFLKRKNGNEQVVIENDPDYQYSETIMFDVSKIRPMISLSKDYSEIYKVSELEKQKIKITEAFIGGCQGGQLKDIKPAYDMLQNNTLPSKSSLTICPASNIILEECTNLGFKEVFDKTCVRSINVGCASCLGTRKDTISTGSIYLTSTLRTFCGRALLPPDITIYQASSITIITSLINGFITDPAKEYYDAAKEEEEELAKSSSTETISHNAKTSSDDTESSSNSEAVQVSHNAKTSSDDTSDEQNEKTPDSSNNNETSENNEDGAESSAADDNSQNEKTESKEEAEETEETEKNDDELSEEELEKIFDNLKNKMDG